QRAKLEIIQSAIVQQNTGEDWSDVRLTVSLSQPSAGGQLPELYPWRLSVAEHEFAKDLPRPIPEMAMSDAVQVTGSRLSRAAAAEANLTGTEWTQNYQIDQRANLPGDNQERRFRLSSSVMDVELSARAVPRIQTQAWLFVKTTFNGETALPPGRLSLYQDNTLVGQNFFAGIRPGAELAASFGVDANIEIDYALIEEMREREGVIRRSTEQMRQYRIGIFNRHDQAIPLTVLDQLPVSTDERIEVALTRETTAPDARDVDGQPGVLAWELLLDGGDEREIIIGYRVNYPEEIEAIAGW
ncbi:MAG: DUF4139 domain-containing protein, partial [Symploca sp. SIO2G7]|nr:DUF4139 domain-containing protein [Symploca sp. SIO2G7]